MKISGCTRFVSRQKCEAKNTVLRRIDPKAYYEHFYREAERLYLPIRLSDGGDFENAEQVEACKSAASRHTSVHAILYTKRLELLPLLVNHPANFHVRCSGWEGDTEGEAYARSLGFDITHMVQDGSGNCPYQKSLAKFMKRKSEIPVRFAPRKLIRKARTSRQSERLRKKSMFGIAVIAQNMDVGVVLLAISASMRLAVLIGRLGWKKREVNYY